MVCFPSELNSIIQSWGFTSANEVLVAATCFLSHLVHVVLVSLRMHVLDLRHCSHKLTWTRLSECFLGPSSISAVGAAALQLNSLWHVSRLVELWKMPAVRDIPMRGSMGYMQQVLTSQHLYKFRMGLSSCIATGCGNGAVG